MPATVSHLEDGRREVRVDALEPGDVILVHRRVGFRRVLEVRRHAPAPGGSADVYVVVYHPAGPGNAFENKSSARGASTYERDAASLRPLDGEATVLAARSGSDG